MKSIWRITKTLMNTNHGIPPLIVSGRNSITIQEKGNIFEGTSEQIFTDICDVGRTYPISTNCMLKDFLIQSLADSVRPTNLFEVAAIVHHLNPREIAGPVGIQSVTLEHLPRLVLKSIVTVFNRSLATNYSSKKCKEAKIAVLPRPDEESAEFYGYKFERNNLKSLIFQLLVFNVIRNDQYGFESESSTAREFLRNVERTTHCFNIIEASLALFLVTGIAFDKVRMARLNAKFIRPKFHVI
jgi:hypothetical protein